jgi:hypothetical protein
MADITALRVVSGGDIIRSPRPRGEHLAASGRGEIPQVSRKKPPTSLHVCRPCRVHGLTDGLQSEMLVRTKKGRTHWAAVGRRKEIEYIPTCHRARGRLNIVATPKAAGLAAITNTTRHLNAETQP